MKVAGHGRASPAAASRVQKKDATASNDLVPSRAPAGRQRNQPFRRKYKNGAATEAAINPIAYG